MTLIDCGGRAKRVCLVERGAQRAYPAASSEVYRHFKVSDPSYSVDRVRLGLRRMPALEKRDLCASLAAKSAFKGMPEQLFAERCEENLVELTFEGPAVCNTCPRQGHILAQILGLPLECSLFIKEWSNQPTDWIEEGAKLQYLASEQRGHQHALVTTSECAAGALRRHSGPNSGSTIFAGLHAPCHPPT